MDEKLLECRKCGTRKWSVLETAKSQELKSSKSVRLPCATCGEYELWKESDYEWQPSGVSTVRGAAKASSIAFKGIETVAAVAPVQKSKAPINYRVHSRRKHERVQLQLPLRVRVDSSTLRFSDVGKTVNMSRSGIYFQSTLPYQTGQIVSVTLNYSPQSVAAPIEHSAVVIRVETPQRASAASGVALMLI